MDKSQQMQDEVRTAYHAWIWHNGFVDNRAMWLAFLEGWSLGARMVTQAQKELIDGH